jgi:hypothetical protein
MPLRLRVWNLRLDGMALVTILVLATLAGLFVIGCGAGNVPGARAGGGTGAVTALPVTDASREFGQVVELDSIREILIDPTLSEEGRLATALSAYRPSLQQSALVLEQRFPREPPLDATIRAATALPVSAGEPFLQRAARIDVSLLRLFYFLTRTELADSVALLTDTNPANDTDLTSGAPARWDQAWAFYNALDDTAQARTSGNPIEFPQFAGTVHELCVLAFLDGQNAILFGAGAPAGGGGTLPRPYAGGTALAARVRVLQYGGGTPGGASPGVIVPTGPDVAAALRQEKLIQRKLVQIFYLSVLREATDLVLRLEANDVAGANVARVRALEFYKALFTLVEQGAGSGVANSLLNLLDTPVASPADFTRDRRTLLVNDLNQALSGVLPPEERVSPVQLQSVRARGGR